MTVYDDFRQKYEKSIGKYTKHLIHRTLDIGSGLVLSIIIQLTIFPFYGIYIEVWAMLHLAIIFMVVSIIRSYLWSKYVFKYGEKT